MCGIIGYVGKKNSIEILTEGLKKLEYRGYDSWGIGIQTNDNILITKKIGKSKQMLNKQMKNNLVAKF